MRDELNKLCEEAYLKSGIINGPANLYIGNELRAYLKGIDVMADNIMDILEGYEEEKEDE